MTDCSRCGQPHPGCTGHRKADGAPCRRPCKPGEVCIVHGGAAPQVAAARRRRQQEAAAAAVLERALAHAYGDDVPDIDPAEAMLRAVSWKYAEVVALRRKVAELDDDDRVWGRTREKTGGEDYGTTHEAKPHIWWAMLRTAEAQLVQFAKDARAAGCDERRVRLAEQTGDQFVVLLRRVLDALYAGLVTAGVPETVLQQAWEQAITDVVAREIRAFQEEQA